MESALPRQIAYFVQDIRKAAAAHHAAFGSGPFVIGEHIALAVSRHRGVDTPVDHSSAYGQWGDLMVEFVQQNNPGPSPFHDMYPQGSGREGLHHVALFAEDMDAAIADFAARGMTLAYYAETTGGLPFAMIDAVAALGHMIELYPPSPALVGFYDHVRRLAQEWDGKALFVEG
jgi:hypothetical protein